MIPHVQLLHQRHNGRQWEIVFQENFTDVNNMYLNYLTNTFPYRVQIDNIHLEISSVYHIEIIPGMLHFISRGFTYIYIYIYTIYIYIYIYIYCSTVSGFHRFIN